MGITHSVQRRRLLEGSFRGNIQWRVEEIIVILLSMEEASVQKTCQNIEHMNNKGKDCARYMKTHVMSYSSDDQTNLTNASSPRNISFWSPAFVQRCCHEKLKRWLLKFGVNLALHHYTYLCEQPTYNLRIQRPCVQTKRSFVMT